MKFFLALFLFSVLSGTLAAQAFIKFREDSWDEKSTCPQCAVCNQTPVDALETHKKITFYCGETLIGIWELTKVELIGCDSVYYRTNSFGKDGMGATIFASDLEAISDICREVRFYCPGALKTRCIDPPNMDYSQHFLRDFFSYKLYTAQDKRAKQASNPAPPPAAEAVEIFKTADPMPRFPGCEEMTGTAAEKKECADKKMLEYFDSRIIYPVETRQMSGQGTVIVTFVVEIDGRITDAKIVRDIGSGCGSEALRVINLMNQAGIRWIPGQKEGKPVRVQFNVPVKFKF